MLAEAVAAVRSGQVSPRELVEESLRRIEAANPALNAVVALRAEEALAEAESAPRDGPLAGLPLLVKDLARCAGMRTTFGSPLYADAPPDTTDDVVVARLKAAGAIVVGRTNVPAFGHTAFTDNRLFGATRNPWNTKRSPGGSSGGSAAALAAGLAPLATSSDGGGSVRIPASACGLVGYKPTNGAVGRNVLPRWIEFSTMGCTGASVDDVLLEASVVLGPVPGDVIALPAGSVSPAPRLPARLVACRTLRADVDADIAAAFDDACRALESELGLPLQRVDRVVDQGTATAWFLMAAAELAQSLLPLREHWPELEPSLRAYLDVAESLSLYDYLGAARRRWEECARVDALLGDDAVLLVPTVNAASWPPEGPLPTRAGSTEFPGIAVNTADFNFTGHPAVSVPLGRDAAGVPFGLQLVAPRGRDGLAFGVAKAWERISPWPATAPGYRPFWPW